MKKQLVIATKIYFKLSKTFLRFVSGFVGQGSPTLIEKLNNQDGFDLR